MQAALIVGGAFLVIIIDYILEFLNFPAVSSTIIVIWILFVWYAIVKYRLKSSMVILLQRGDRGYYITVKL